MVWTIIVAELVDIGMDFDMDFGISFRCLQVLMQCLWLTLADLVVIVGRDGGGHAFGELRQALLPLSMLATSDAGYRHQNRDLSQRTGK